MVITSATLPNAYTPATRPAAAAQQQAAPADSFVQSAGTRSLSDNLKVAGLVTGFGAVGFVAGLATGIPVVGPIIGGVAGAVAGASSGALAALALPGEHVKAGAVIGGVAGAILGSQGPHPIVTGALTAGMATVPFGLLIAIFSSAE